MENIESERRMVKLETDLGNIKELLLEIKEDIRSQPYVPRAEINLMMKSMNDRIDNIEQNKKESRTLIIAWFGIAISITSVILAFFHK